jgi:hypothetical protein
VLLASLLAISLTLPLFMLSWQRFMFTGRAEAVGALGDLSSDWAFLWRWWALSFIANGVGDSLAKQGTWLAGVLHMADPAPLRIALTIIASLGVLAAFGLPFGLDLPAIAREGRKMPAAERGAMLRKLGRGFPRGLILAGGLYPALVLLPSPKLLAGQFAALELAALCLATSLMSFMAVAVFSTYLCRAYLSAGAQLASEALDTFD